MKVYGTWHYFEGGEPCYAVVATKTKKRAMELFKQSRYTFDNYSCETGNKENIKQALDNPDQVVIIRHIKKPKRI